MSQVYLSSSSHYPLFNLVYFVGFDITSVFLVTVYVVADVAITVTLVATIDTLFTVLFISYWCIKCRWMFCCDYF